MTIFEWLAVYSEYLMPMVLALLGGFVRALHANINDRSWGFTAVMVVTAAFTGAIVFLFLQDYRQSLPRGMLAAITGIAGFLGTDLLRVVSFRMMKIAERWGEIDQPNETTIIPKTQDSRDEVERLKHELDNDIL